jgi:NAD(P)-dependent dehydrogenase (short-subunit alcohol dehydrogenase family)
MYDLSGKVALVTGAGGELGMGRTIAMRLAQEGADVVVSDLLAQPYGAGAAGWGGLPQVVAEIRALGRRASAIQADIGDEGSVEELLREMLAQFGQIDILVNSSGAPAGPDRVPVVELDVAQWDKVQRINVRGTFLVCRAAARAMIQRNRGGKIITMSSVSGKRASARFSAYCASKFAVIGFTQALAAEMAPYHINVNALCPGLVDTERFGMLAAAMAPAGTTPAASYDAYMRRAEKDIPWGRVAHTSDVAGVAAFLASSESDYLTGLAISISGGLLME